MKNLKILERGHLSTVARSETSINSLNVLTKLVFSSNATKLGLCNSTYAKFCPCGIRHKLIKPVLKPIHDVLPLFHKLNILPHDFLHILIPFYYFGFK